MMISVIHLVFLLKRFGGGGATPQTFRFFTCSRTCSCNTLINGREFLALIDSDHNCKVVVTDIVQKLVFQDEEGNTISETDASLVGKVIQVRFDSLH